MIEVLNKLIAVLQLKKIDDQLFEGCSEDLGFKNVFGGQVCGQAMMAAYHTVEDRIAHSMHGYFLRPGDHSLPIQYETQILRDGGTFSARQRRPSRPCPFLNRHEELLSLTRHFHASDRKFLFYRSSQLCANLFRS